MKKKILLLLITMFALLGSRAYATDYDLWVVGVQVTSSNANNVQNYWIQNGFVRYDAESNTLTLEHVSIHPSSLMATDGIRSEIPNLKIVLTGASEIDCYGDGIISDGNLTIEGTGSLSLTSPIRMTSGNLLVKQCELSIGIVHGANSGIIAAGDCRFDEGCNVTISSHHCIQGTQNKHLVIYNSTLKASIPFGGLMGCSLFSGFGSLLLYHVVMLWPRGADYNDSTHNFEDPEGETPRNACFVPDTSVSSYLAVAGNELRGNSGVYHFSDTYINGSVAYNFSTNTLTLDNAEISPLSGISGIVSGIPDLKIELIGSNSIEADYNGIYSYGNLNLCGTGALEIDVDSYIGIEVESGNLCIDNCVVTSSVASQDYGMGIRVEENCTIKNAACVYAKGCLAGIQGSEGKTLSVQDASLQALVSGNYLVSAISGFSHLVTTQPSDIYPADASYDETDRRMECNGNVLNRVCIDPRNTGLWVAGIRVNGNNPIFNFAGEGITGSVEYTLRTKVLTLTNASISGGDGFAIRSNVPGLKIKLVGSNTISGDGGIVASRNFEMQDEGTLQLNNEGHGILALDDLGISQCSINSGCCSVYGNMALTNSALNVQANSNAISGQQGKTLSVNGSDVSARNNAFSTSAISGFSRLSLTDTYLTYPVGGIYDEIDRRLETSGGGIVSEAVIETVNHSLWVAGHKLEGESGTYTFTGQGVTSGNVTYNFSTNTLTLNNAVISAGSDYGINNHIPNLTLELLGANSISGASYGAYSFENMTIRGTGGLDINVSGQYGFHAKGDVAVDGCTINVKSTYQNGNSYGVYAEGDFTVQDAAKVAAEAKHYAIYGQQGKTLSVNGSDVYAKNTDSSRSAISGFSHLSLTDTSLTYPVGGAYDESDRRLETSTGGNVHEAVIETVNHSLWVAGHKLEGESGTYTFSGSGITSGSVTYNFSTNTLTLNNAVISAGSDYGIKSLVPNLTLELVGDNSIAGASYGAYSFDNTTIHGTGSLDINVSDQYGFYANGDVTVDGCALSVKSTYQGAYFDAYGIYAKGDFTIQDAANVTAEAKHYAIYGQQGKTLSVNGSDLYAKNNYNYASAISGFSHLSLTGTSLTYPIGGTYNESDRRLKTPSESYVHEAVIETVNHSLWVAGHKLEGESGTYTFTGQGITSGSITYNFSTNTLTLDNAVISAGSEYGIKSYIPNLTLELVGGNSIAGSSYGAYSFDNTAIHGTGSLDINVSGQYGFYANGDVTVDGCALSVKSTYQGAYSDAYGIYAKGNFTVQDAASVTAEAYDYAIYGQQGKTLTVNGSDVSAKNNRNYASAISGFSHLSLTGTSLTYPIGGTYNESDRRLKTPSESYVHEAVIESVNHSLWVAGHKLEGESGTYTFTGQGITSGSITYNFSTNTLTLDNAVISAGSEYGIKSYIANLTLELVGDNSIAGSSYGAYSFDNTAIHGTGSLDINVSGQYGFYANGDVTVDGCALSVKSTHQGAYFDAYGIYAKGDFTIQDAASVTAEAYDYAIYGQQGKTLSVNGSDVSAKNNCNYESAISGFSHLSLTGTSLTYPIGGTYDESDRRLETSSGSNVHEAVIETVNHSLWVAGHKLEGESGTYTFSGSGITSGNVTYNFSTNTLTLDNAVISAGSEYGIKSLIPNLTLELVGDNSIAGASYGAYSFDNTTIHGTGSLDINVSDQYGFYANGDVTVDGCALSVKSTYQGYLLYDYGIYAKGNITIEGAANMTAEAKHYAIYGQQGKTLSVNGSDVSARNNSSSSASAISGFSHLSLTGTSLTYPVGGTYDESERRLEYPAGAVAHTVSIETVNRSLGVAGHKLVGDDGTYAFTGDGIIGSATYDFTTNTLTLENATINAGIGNGIENGLTDLNIVLVGSNRINGSSNGVYSSQNINFLGSGSLDVVVSGTYGIYVTSCVVSQCTINVKTSNSVNAYVSGIRATGSFTVNENALVTADATNRGCGIYVNGICTIEGNANVSATGYDIGVQGVFSYNIIVNGGNLYAKNTSSINSVIQGFADLEMSGGSHVTMPMGASYQSNRMGISGLSIHEVAIEVDNHSLWVAGHKLEGNNGTYAFSGPGITSGSVTYDFSTNTLTLNNANIDCNSGSYGIKNYIPNLKIELVGNNTISASSYGIYSSSWSNLTIYGFGHLNVDVPYDYGIYVHDDLTVKQCVLHVEKASTLYVENRYYGLYVFGDLSLSNVSEVTSEVSQNNSTDGSTAYAYGVYVSGSVTMTNFSDLTGRATFTNHENKHSYGIYASGGFTVTKSHVTATSSETDGIYVGGDFVVQGEGDVWAAGGENGINVFGDLTVKELSNLYADGVDCGVHGTGDEFFNVYYSTVDANCSSSSEHSAIEGFVNMPLLGTYLTEPEGGRYDASEHRMEDAVGNLAHDVNIAYPTYPLRLAGVQVCEPNAADIFGDGTARYDNSTHTLTLENADILSRSWGGIFNEVDGLKINLIGENNILDNGTSCIISSGAMTFMGTGTLTVTGLCGIHTSSNLTLQGGCTLNVNGSGSNSCSAIICNGSDKTLTIDHSTLDATCPNTTIGTLTGFTTLSLNGSTIVRPAGSMWSSELRCLTKNGQKVFGEVIIDYREFELYVAGVRVTSANADDVLGDGTVSFNATTQTLTLNNTYVHNANVDGIKTTLENLTIMLNGSNYFDVGNHYGLDIETEGAAAITITGPGSLRFIAHTGIHASNPFRKVLSITNDSHVYVDATQNGVQFYPGRVQVDHASLSVKGENYCISANWLDLTETSILAPDGAEFDPLNGSVVYAGTHTAVSGEYVRIAPQPYKLWVAGIQVNDAISDDVLGDGKVSYDASENVLTLNGVDINATTYGIRAGIEDLTLRLVGTNNVVGGTYGILAEDDLIIEGTGILNVSGRTGILCYYTDIDGNHYPVNLTIKDGCTVNANGNASGTIGMNVAGIKGDTSTNSTLTISNCRVTAICPGTPVGTVHGFSNLVMNNVRIASPSGAAWNASLHCIATNGTPVTEQVVFSPNTFNLFVKGQQVDYCNAFDVLADGGTVTYDWTENELTLNNATIVLQSNNSCGIQSSIASLSIKLINHNTIQAQRGVYATGGLSIEGDGVLDVSATRGIFVSNNNLTIQGGCTVNATGTTNSAIAGSSGKTLTISGSRVTATSGGTNSVISGFSNLVLNNVAVSAPAGATYSTTNRQLETSSHEIVTGTAVIEGIPYDLWINGVQLNSLNCQHFTGDDNSIEGDISYDHSNNTLTLNNATINYIGSYTPTIRNEMGYLKIKLIGLNFLNGYDFEESYAMEVHSGQGWMVIEGPGTLMSNSSIIFADGGCRLDIEEGALVNLYSIGQEDDASLRSSDGSFIDLTVDGAALMAHKVKDLYRPVLGPYASITSPSGTNLYQDSNDLWYVGYLSGNHEEAENVVIENTYGISVANTPITSRNAQHVEGDGIMGNISYNVFTHTLTLDNATVNAQYDGLESYLEDETLTISLIGHNTISGASGRGLLLQNSTVIEAGDASGDDWLTVAGLDGILMESGDFLTIQGGCHIETSATYSGWQAGLYADGQDLTISNSSVVAHNLSGNPCSAITGFGNVILNGVGVLQPYGAEWEDENFQVGGSYVNDIEIGYVEYDLKIADIPVTSANAHQITGPGISGNVWYDASSNTLNLENATIDVLQSNVLSAIENHIDGLTINIIGYDNTIRGYEDGISLYDCNTTITRNDAESFTALNVVAPYGIFGYNDNEGGAGAALTISNGVEVLVVSEENGFYVKDVTIDRSTVNVYGNLYANVLRLEGAEILSPEGAYWDGGSGFICDADGSRIDDYLTIGMESYDLYVAGVQVGTYNANDITGEGISGHVYYDEASNTLTLDNATLVYDNAFVGRGIQNHIDGLTIQLVGENHIATNKGEGIRIYGPCENLNITGSGTLDIAAGHGITSQVPVVVNISDGCSININALYTGVNLESGTLIVNYADLSTAAANNSSLHAAGLQLVGVDFIAPEGAYWQEEDGYVNNANGSYVTDGVAVVIGNKAYDLWVAGTQVTSANAIHIEGSGIDGEVSYDSGSNTLTLDNASVAYFNNGYGYAIDSELNDLTINLIGENNLHSDNDGISISGNTTIKGEGILNIESNYGIISYEAIDLTISDGCQVNITGGNEGLSLYSLIVDNARVTVSGERFKSVNTRNLQLTDVEIASPEGAYWNGSAVVDAQGNYVTDQVVIAPYNIFHGMVSTDWSEPDNWTNRIVPNANSSITIDAVCTVNDDVRAKSVQIADDATVYVLAGQALSAESVTDTDASQLVVDEGAEVTTTTPGTKATVRKSVDAWGENTGWNLIAAPIADANLSTNTTLTDQGDFDLYGYDETNHNEQEWVNYKAVPFESLVPGQGYLFANDMDNWHQFTGELNAAMVSIGVTYTPESGYPLSGFNLIGNPFAHNIYKGSGCAIDDSNLEEGYYTLSDEGEWQAQADGTPIAPCQAILVRTDATTTLNIANTTAAPSNAKGEARRLKLTVEGNRLTDQVFITEGEGRSLKKIAHVNPNAPTLYVKDGEKDCAIAFTNGEKSLTLCFKAKTVGSYTLRLDETTIGKDIVRLTDTMTGETVKLHVGETYTFSAAPGDKAERFTVMMK